MQISVFNDETSRRTIETGEKQTGQLKQEERCFDKTDPSFMGWLHGLIAHRGILGTGEAALNVCCNSKGVP
jgi:hypothetical protein